MFHAQMQECVLTFFISLRLTKIVTEKFLFTHEDISKVQGFLNYNIRSPDVTNSHLTIKESVCYLPFDGTPI